MKSNAKSIWAAAAEMEPNALADLPPTTANKRRVSLDLGPSLVPSFVVLPCFGGNAFGLTYRSSPSYEGSATRVRQAPWRTRTERSVDIAKANSKACRSWVQHSRRAPQDLRAPPCHQSRGIRKYTDATAYLSFPFVIFFVHFAFHFNAPGVFYDRRFSFSGRPRVASRTSAGRRTLTSARCCLRMALPR